MTPARARRWWRAALGRLGAGLAVSGALPYWRYRLVIGQLPIACVDVLPIRPTASGYDVGLIKRTDEHGQLRWAMVGGGVHRNETIADALDRHVKTTLGTEAQIDLAGLDEVHPHAVGQYFPQRRRGFGHDPRKHAIALSYWAAVSGSIAPMGEAVAFEWFALKALPPAEDFGYGHDLTVARLIEALPQAR